MKKTFGWLFVLLVAALVVSACGPQMATPTPGDQAATGGPATTVPVSATPTSPPGGEPTQPPVSAAELPVDPDDWHVLGSPDAAVTLVEYSDFQ